MFLAYHFQLACKIVGGDENANLLFDTLLPPDLLIAAFIHFCSNRAYCSRHPYFP